jgi:hypothetical protein
VKSPKTPPEITTVDADAIRFAAKYGWGPVSKPYFDIPKWVFSGLNAGTRIDSIVLTRGNVTRDVRGLCAGDVNGSYLPPNGYKMAEPTLELVNRGTLPITGEITFPVRAQSDMEIGAITLMLDFDPELIEITGVSMPENGGVEPWFEVQSSRFKVGETTNLEPGTLNILQIGWASLNPINVSRDEILLLIHARPSSLVPRPSSLVLRFTLNANPLSELADGNGNVLYDARLSVADAGGKVQGSRFKVEAARVVVYPNPAKDVLNVEFVSGDDNNAVTLQLVTIQGILISTKIAPDIKPGFNKTTLDLRDLPNGAYILKVAIGGQIEASKVIVNR